MKSINLHTSSDEMLMEQYQVGNKMAFAILYERYAGVLLRFILKMLHYDKNTADDVLHDVFVKLAEDPHKFDVKRNFKAWVFTVAANQSKRLARKPSFETLDLHLPAHSDNQQKHIETEEFSAHLQQALKQLSYEHRCTFILRYEEKMSVGEIAEIMDCPQGTVKSRIHHCIKLLSSKLATHNPLTQTS